MTAARSIQFRVSLIEIFIPTRKPELCHHPFITHTNKDEAISPDNSTENIQRAIGHILFCAKCQAENARPISFFMKGHQIRRQL